MRIGDTDMKKIPVVVICGPTATGKTKLSVEICKRFSGEVINADSVQIYKYMDIGSAKPDEEERGGVVHHMMDIVEPYESFNVSDYCRRAGEAIADVYSRGKLPVLVGGTGMYIDSLMQGIDFFDIKNDYEYRDALSKRAKEEGLLSLYEELVRIDAKSAETIDKNDEKRIIRALEIYHTTGKTKSYFVEKSKETPSKYAPLYIGLNYHNRELMYARIHKRVDEMLNAGLIDEVNVLMDIDGFLTSTASAAIGYKELYPYIRGEESIEDALFKIKQNTTRYAKRQLTWFRRNKEMNWLYIDGEGGFDAVMDEAANLVSLFINKN